MLVTLAAVLAGLVGAGVVSLACVYLWGRPPRPSLWVETEIYKDLVALYMTDPDFDLAVETFERWMETAFARFAAGEIGDPQYQPAPLEPRRWWVLATGIWSTWVEIPGMYARWFRAIAQAIESSWKRGDGECATRYYRYNDPQKPYRCARPKNHTGDCNGNPLPQLSTPRLPPPKPSDAGRVVRPRYRPHGTCECVKCRAENSAYRSGLDDRATEPY